MRRGYITVFLSLSLTLILSLVFTVIEGARISAIRMKFECVADIGMNSVLAEYHRELLEQYDLLFVDTAYGGTRPDIGNTEAHLENYMEMNFRPKAQGGFRTRDFLSMDVTTVNIDAYLLHPTKAVLFSKDRLRIIWQIILWGQFWRRFR